MTDSRSTFKLSKRDTKTRSRSTLKSRKKKSHVPGSTRIFLYLKMEEILNLPSTAGQFILKLEQTKNTITKLEDRYTTDTEIDLSTFDIYKPTFSLTIEQDSIEDLNGFSNNPLRITLYEVLSPQVSEHDDAQYGAEDRRAAAHGLEQKVEYKPLAQGMIELLQFFCRTRTYEMSRTFLYPLARSDSSVHLPTCLTVWQIYTLLPLLKNINFCNLAYITFESIYNANPYLAEISEKLAIDISFESNIPNDVNQFDKIKICDFKALTEEVIAYQNFNIIWESLKDCTLNNSSSLGLHTGTKLTKSRLLKKLYANEDVNFYFDGINLDRDMALVCNSTHRFILTDDLVKILEDIAAFNSYHLLVEIYNIDTPDEIILQGVVDLSIFMYPMVNAIRYAVELLPIGGRSPSTFRSRSLRTSQLLNKSKRKRSDASAKGAKGDSKFPISSSGRPKPTFAILNICLVSPITENEESVMKSGSKLYHCKLLQAKSETNTAAEICEDIYRQFDDHIGMLINHILVKNIDNLLVENKFFCCQVQNLTNKIMKLISCDYNLRFPTKTNLEFTNLMTTVYNELMQRIYKVVQKCDTDKRGGCFMANSKSEEKLISLTGVIKYLHEVNKESMAEFLYDKIKNKYEELPAFAYYQYVYNVEKCNFEAARKYHDRPIKDRLLDGEYYCQLINVYMNYMDDLSSEENSSEALEELLDSLQNLSNLFPIDSDVFILMYCLYKNCAYLPGISYMRWRYETLYETPRRELPNIPISLWDMYCNYDPVFNTPKGLNFYEVAKMFLRLGLYKFAQIVYQEIAAENTEAERYLIMTTMKILLKEVDKKCTAKTFPTDKQVNGGEIKAYNIHVNGNLEYYLGATDAAMKNYAHILHVKDTINFEYFQLGLFRYGYKTQETHEYEQAMKAFKLCCVVGANCVIHKFEIGKLLYRLNRLPEADASFAKATEFGIHIPDLWAYLALVNLKMGQNFKALEFWKYAKLNPKNVISEEILDELSKIKYEDVILYVDVPNIM